MKKRQHRILRELESFSPSLFGPDLFGDFTPAEAAVDKTVREMLASRKAVEAVGDADALALESNPETSKLLFLSFGSGSSGNCSYLGTHRHGILIDAGVEREKVEEGLKTNGIDINGIVGILLTHDHSDHICQAYSILRKYKAMKLYSTPKTLTGLLRRHNVSRRIKDYHSPIYIEYQYQIGPFEVTAFGTSHDGTDNVGYMFDYKGRRFVVATDMGKVTERADHYIRLSNYLMIEANYDLTMLLNGPYKDYLKARIISERGHMDNKETAALLADIISSPREENSGTLSEIFLCHLSEDNNTPEKALTEVREALEKAGAQVRGPMEMRKQGAVTLSVLPRYELSALYVLR